jgi:hypothetical protein
MSGIIEFKPKVKVERESIEVVKPEPITLQEFVEMLGEWQDWLEASSDFYEKVTLRVSIELVS